MPPRLWTLAANLRLQTLDETFTAFNKLVQILPYAVELSDRIAHDTEG